MELLPFEPGQPPRDPVFNVQEIPKELDIFFRGEEAFLPEGKTSFDELTPEEMQLLRSQYRFSPLRPGLYQTLTGFKGMI